MEFKKRKEITFLSNFSWSCPNVLELLAETAVMSSYNVHYYSKPTSIFSKFYDKNFAFDENNLHAHPLNIFSAKLCNFKFLNSIQNAYIWKQLHANINYNHTNILFYNNLDVVSGLCKKLKDNFNKLIYLCADYSDFNDRLSFNCRIADHILLIPETMSKVLNSKYPEKKVTLWPQLVSSSQEECPTSDKSMIDKFLLNIPKPRIIYAGDTRGRVIQSCYKTTADQVKHCSFISFHNGKYEKIGNIFKLPWINKLQMHYLISQCQVGFMPYNIEDPHNLHCVPLKLFDYFKHGLPVVSSRLLNLEKFKDIIYLCDDTYEYVRCILLSLKEMNAEYKKEKRIDIFKSHSTSFNRTNFSQFIESIF